LRTSFKSLNALFGGRTTGREKSAFVEDLISANFSLCGIEKLFVTIQYIVMARNVVGKLSFFNQNGTKRIFALRRYGEMFKVCVVCPMV